MGGKKNQRTKGNTRPSSSGRIAELLTASGTPVNSLVGFDCSSNDNVSGFSSSFGPITTPSKIPDDSESCLDTDLQLLIKKMSKKDSVTKLKSIQEFTELLKKKDDALVKSFLPHWPRLYTKMALDCDWRVREASHKAHQQLVIKARRKLAPHLRSLMGVWLISQCDPYAPAASAAIASLKAAFPLQEKQAEAYAFCKNDVLTFIQDMLFQQTAQTISDPKHTSPEEMESKYTRLVICCLEGMCVLISELPESHRAELSDSLRNSFVSNDAFWKIRRNKDAHIQSAWFKVISCLCKYAPFVLTPHAEKVSKAVLGSISIFDPLIVQATWESILCILTAVPDAWQYVSIQKMILPQLWKVLREGGKGNATVIFPNILPFLSKFPSHVTDASFYRTFFASIVDGMNEAKVVSSASELNALVKSFLECARYVLIQHSESPVDNTEILNIVIVENLLSLLQSSITEKQSKLCLTQFYTSLSELIHYFSNQAHLDANEEKRKEFEKMLSLFWDNFFVFCNSVLGSFENVSAEEWKLERLADFFQTLHHLKLTTKSKRETQVHFKDSSEISDASVENQSESQRPGNTFSYSEIESKTQELAVIIFGKLCSHMKLPYLKLLATVIECAPSENLFIRLLSKQDDDTLENPSVKQFFDEVVWSWIDSKNMWFQSLDVQQLFLRYVMDIVCSLISCLNKENGLEILSELAVAGDPQVILCLLEKTVKANEDSVLSQWFKSEEASTVIVEMSQELLELSLCSKCNEVEVKHEAECIWKALQICFSSVDDKPVVAVSCITQVLSIFQSALMKPDLKDLSLLIEFSWELVLILFRSYTACWDLPGMEDLLLALFKIGFQGISSESLQKKVEEAWQIGVRHLFKAKGGFLKDGGFFAGCTQYINNMLINQIKTKPAVKHLSHVMAKLLTSVFECIEEDGEDEGILYNDTVLLLLRTMLPTSEQWKNLDDRLSDICLVHSITRGSMLYCDFPSAPSQDFAIEFQALVHPQLATIEILAMLQKQSSSTTRDATNHHSSCVEDQMLLVHLPHLLLAYSFCKGISGGRPLREVVSEESYCLKEILDLFLECISNCIDSLSAERKIGLLLFMFKQAKLEGRVWVLAFDCTLQLMKDAKFIDIWQCLKIEDNLFPCDTIEDIQSLQCLIPRISEENRKRLISNAINMLLCSDDYFVANGVMGYLSLLSTSLPYVKEADASYLKDDIIAVVEYLNSLKKNSPNYFASDKALAEKSTDVLVFCSQVCCFLQTTLKHFSSALSTDHWDFLLCSLTSWIECIRKHRENLTDNLALVCLASQCFILLELSGEILSSIPSSPAKEEFPPNLYVEWTEFFTERLYQNILLLFIYLSNLVYGQTQDAFLGPLMEDIASTLKYASETCILDLKVEPIEEKDSDVQNVVQLPTQVSCILDQFCPLLVHRNYGVQVGAHTVLLKIMSTLPALAINNNCEGNELPDSLSPPQSILKMLNETNIVVDTMLMEFRVGSCCIVQPYTDSYSYTLGYLLSWIHLSEFFSASSSEDRSRYAAFFQESSLLSSLLLNLFKLMPVINLVLPENGSKDATFFTEAPNLNPKERATSTHLQHLACQVYFMTLRKFPALVRQWWTGQDKVTADIVNKYTSKFVSSLICGEELKAVHNSSNNFTNMSVITRPVAREVVARYSIDDASIELVIILPPNHPLGIVNVESRKKVKIGNAQWRNWMLQLTTFLMHQNGTILDALSLWKKNVDKRFEGVEECMVCFSVLHGSTCQLPRLLCRTCKKKFHSVCLYKWFNTSNNTTCPLCRNLF